MNNKTRRQYTRRRCLRPARMCMCMWVCTCVCVSTDTQTYIKNITSKKCYIAWNQIGGVSLSKSTSAAATLATLRAWSRIRFYLQEKRAERAQYLVGLGKRTDVWYPSRLCTLGTLAYQYLLSTSLLPFGARRAKSLQWKSRRAVRIPAESSPVTVPRSPFPYLSVPRGHPEDLSERFYLFFFFFTLFWCYSDR